MTINSSMFSSKKHEWGTPIEIFNQLKKEFSFKLDACTSEDNPLGTPYYHTKEDNGLKRKWQTWTFVNPPFKDVSLWVHKALEENAMRGIGSVLLLPARTDTKWFHGPIWHTGQSRPQIGREVRFIKGRLKFNGALSSAPFPSMIVVFRRPGQLVSQREWNKVKGQFNL